jgi:hypothetical protein
MTNSPVGGPTGEFVAVLTSDKVVSPYVSGLTETSGRYGCTV